MAGFQGFPRGTRYTLVPNLLLSYILEEIDSLAELKCTLRVMGLRQQQRSRGMWVTLGELLADPVLLKALAQEPGGALEAISRGTALAVERGTLLQTQGVEGESRQTVLLVNDEAGRRTLAQWQPGAEVAETQEFPGEGSSGPRPNIFSLYEENIGPLTPLLVDELKEAEVTHPWDWIEEAFKEAVSRNKRSWRYIARILERWAAEGKDNGEPGRHSQTTDPKEYLRRYGRLNR